MVGVNLGRLFSGSDIWDVSQPQFLNPVQTCVKGQLQLEYYLDRGDVIADDGSKDEEEVGPASGKEVGYRV